MPQTESIKPSVPIESDPLDIKPILVLVLVMAVATIVAWLLRDEADTLLGGDQAIEVT
jgi:hypothetical protein